jgi:hypothetical protein
MDDALAVVEKPLEYQECTYCGGKGAIEGYLYGESKCVTCLGTGKLEVGGWLGLVHEEEITFEYRTDENGKTLMRGTMHAPMCIEDALECLAHQVPERTNWADHVVSLVEEKVISCTGALPRGIAEDKIVTTEYDIPVVLQPFVPSTYVLRHEIRTQHRPLVAGVTESADQVAPEPFALGEAHYTTRGWDLEANDYVVDGVDKQATIRPDPLDVTKCYVVTFDRLPSWCPLTVAEYVICNQVYSRARIVLEKYIAYRDAKMNKQVAQVTNVN